MAEAPGDSGESDYEPAEELEDESPNDVIEEDHEYLRHHIATLKMDDAVLEPGILKTFEDYLELGGESINAIRYLSSGYKGLPLMINVLVDWLHFAGCRRKDIQTLVEEHIKTLIIKDFDPKKADLIFTEEGSTPSWLEEMICFQTWRELFYQLTDQYPDCLMLKFTMKLIADAGYQGEITSASSAAHQPEVFCGLIKTLLTDIITASSPNEMEESLKEFCETRTVLYPISIVVPHFDTDQQLVSHSQHTYFYSQALIKTLENRQPENRQFTQWLAGEVQRDARKRKLDVTNMTLHFNGIGSHAKVFESLSSMLSRNALNPADVSALYYCYAEEEKQPSVKFLHNAQFLELLVQTLFKPGSNINPDHKEKYLYLLAYATSVYEAPNEDGELVPIKDDLIGAQEAIETAQGICSGANDSYTELLTQIGKLFECLRYPIVSMGVFRWVESTVTNPSFFEVSAETTSLVLVLLDEIASCHPLQHTYIMSLLQRLLEASYPSLEVQMQELKRTFLDHMIHLLSCDHVIPVVSYIHKCMISGTLDHSLIRYFVSEVLSIIGPPYSTEFTSVFLPLLQNDEIVSSLVSQTKDDPVSLFLAECPHKSKKKKKSKNN